MTAHTELIPWRSRLASEFPQTELVLWRDSRDEEQITIGSVTRLAGRPPRYTAWLTLHIDALLFLADKQMYDVIREARPEEFPLALHLDLRLLES